MAGGLASALTPWRSTAPSARQVRLRALLLLLGAAVWFWCAHELWKTTVPSGLAAPHLDPRTVFSAQFLRRSASFDRFLDIDSLLALVTLIAVLAVYARHGQALMRESAAGPIGTGILLGMLGYALVWLAEVPFGLAGVWWERKHHISHQGYGSYLVESFLALGSRFIFVAMGLAIWMALARRTRRWWWAAAAPLFAALALLFAFVSPYLIAKTHPLRDPALASRAARLAAVEGVPGTKVVVQVVSRKVTDPNAESVGFGPTRRVVLWDTLLDGRFSEDEEAVVVAHELGHIAHDHIVKGVGWYLLFLIPATGLMALATRRRGGMGRPEAVPVALLVLVVLQVATMPLAAMVSRRSEAEADWSALTATRDGRSARALFTRLATTSLADPDPPTWSYVLFADHPTIAQRIATAGAFDRHEYP